MKYDMTARVYGWYSAGSWDLIIKACTGDVCV